MILAGINLLRPQILSFSRAKFCQKGASIEESGEEGPIVRKP